MVSGKIVWAGKPSQWVNVNVFGAAIIVLVAFRILESNGVVDELFDKLLSLPEYKGYLRPAVFLFVAAFIAWRCLVTHFHTYELTEEVFREYYGVLNRVTHELELYRVNDTMVYKPFTLNILGLGNVIMHTSDASNPVTIIKAIKNSNKVREIIRFHVEKQRSRKGIVEVGNR